MIENDNASYQRYRFHKSDFTQLQAAVPVNNMADPDPKSEAFGLHTANRGPNDTKLRQQRTNHTNRSHALLPGREPGRSHKDYSDPLQDLKIGNPYASSTEGQLFPGARIDSPVGKKNHAALRQFIKTLKGWQDDHHRIRDQAPSADERGIQALQDSGRGIYHAVVEDVGQEIGLSERQERGRSEARRHKSALEHLHPSHE